MNLVVLPEAIEDVYAQAAYYRDQGSTDTATRWLQRARRTFEFIAANPELGFSVRPGLRACRVEKFKRQVVVYRLVGDRVEIVRVLHGASDLDQGL